METMRVLIVGGGGREHALAWKVKLDDPGAQVTVAPGNAGTENLGVNLAIRADDIQGLLEWARQHRPDVVLVGPEGPLCAGLGDALQAEGFAAFGPNRHAARLEGSKLVTKQLLQRHRIPTAAGGTFAGAAEALAFSQTLPYPQVIKADGLASGKGVIIASNPWQATQAIYQMMGKRAFGDAGERVVIEAYLEGREASIHLVTDGKTYRLFPVSQDHKRIRDGDAGPNTGGMGAYAPAPLVDGPMLARIGREILDPLFPALRAEGIDFRGVLYVGLMITSEGPKVLEFNVRFGDPEAQVLLPLMQTRLVDLALAVHEQRLEALDLHFHERHAVAVVLAAHGYPEAPRLGDRIEGLEEAADTGALIFHAGSRGTPAGVISAGGRVLAVTGLGASLEAARKLAYDGAGCIRFQGCQFRRDIAARTTL
jgi:phosphoribosylamine--glycine ligase